MYIETNPCTRWLCWIPTFCDYFSPGVGFLHHHRFSLRSIFASVRITVQALQLTHSIANENFSLDNENLFQWNVTLTFWQNVVSWLNRAGAERKMRRKREAPNFYSLWKVFVWENYPKFLLQKLFIPTQGLKNLQWQLLWLAFKYKATPNEKSADKKLFRLVRNKIDKRVILVKKYNSL